MREFGYLAKAVADETRLRILCAVRQQELCVCQLVDLLGLAQSTVSKHMGILHRARLVDSRRDGRWMLYRAATGPEVPVSVRSALAWVYESLCDEARIQTDAERLAEVLGTDRETLCQRKTDAN